MMALDEHAEPITALDPHVAADEPEKSPTQHKRVMIQRFLDQQAQEMAIRAQETQVRQLEVRAAYRYSRASLDAQERDLKDQRSEERKKRRDQIYFVAFALLLLAALVVYLLNGGKDELAREILKAVVYISMAATSGFYAGKSSERRKQESDEK
jgi:hypothetical protein